MMIVGVVWAIAAGIVLGLYALPEKFTKGFNYENTWGLFFLLTMFVVPIIASVMLIDGFAQIFTSMPTDILIKMALASFLWGTGVMMWGKAINHIGLSLGFSLFIGTVILVGSLLPFLVDGLPPTNALIVILVGLVVVLAGIVSKARAGLIREQDEQHAAEASGGEVIEKESMAIGIFIAVFGGLLATGFSYANAVGRPFLHEASQQAGNADWITAVAVMFPIFISGGIAMTTYFLWLITKKQAWGDFKTSHFGKNVGLILVMAVFHYAASAMFAYAAYRLGDAGNSVGYAIFNTASVATAIVSGIITKEWVQASRKARNYLYVGLTCMVVGIIIISVGNGMAY